MNEIITIISNDQIYQTTRGTISKNKYLKEKINDSKIQLNMSSKSVNIILNYLRDGALPNDIVDVENDLKVCGIVYDTNVNSIDMVSINIGGKLFSVDKLMLQKKLEYFNKFFQYNAKHYPDYSSVLIDRCFYKFEKILDHFKNPWVHTLDDEIKLELDYYISNVNFVVDEFIDINYFSHFQLGCHKYNNKSASWQLITKDDVTEFLKKDRLWQIRDYPWIHDDYREVCEVNQIAKYVIIHFESDIDYELVKKGYIWMNNNILDISQLLLKNVAIIDYENNILSILYDSTLYNGNRAHSLNIFFLNEIKTKIKSINNFMYKDINQYYDEYGFIESTVSNIYTIDNLDNTSVIQFNINDIIEYNKQNYPLGYSKKYQLSYPYNDISIDQYLYRKINHTDNDNENNDENDDENNNDKYDTFIFSILDIQNRPDMIISHLEILSDDQIICKSKVIFDGQNYRINKLYNDHIGLKYLLTNHDLITIKLYLAEPISGDIHINYTYNCSKSLGINKYDSELSNFIRR
ncbi:BTB/POZ domain-containing protein [Megavirus baoshan]|uniref:BTB/POZ domain-containing protein n=1 Tax=Megavirus baoshan TaxID=2496520 RepID=A0A3S8UXT9_9VIRU|nr:BTB/POZ domain-containing protein [Megavirus baoshan]AZL89636.1 BTB/POZ domain-containing protein [Megavirus baoshan]